MREGVREERERGFLGFAIRNFSKAYSLQPFKEVGLRILKGWAFHLNNPLGIGFLFTLGFLK